MVISDSSVYSPQAKKPNNIILFQIVDFDNLVILIYKICKIRTKNKMFFYCVVSEPLQSPS
jgi:hypothetical protein